MARVPELVRISRLLRLGLGSKQRKRGKDAKQHGLPIKKAAEAAFSLDVTKNQAAASVAAAAAAAALSALAFALVAVLAYLFLNFSTRPAVSRIFCLPV